jgi:hypothetical protein
MLLLNQILRNIKVKAPSVLSGLNTASERFILKLVELKSIAVKFTARGQKPPAKVKSRELVESTVRWFDDGFKVFKESF